MRDTWLFRLLILAGLTLCLAQPGSTQNVTTSELMPVTSTAGGLTNRTGLTFCRGILEGGAIRLALDGSTPTSTLGRPLTVGDRLFVNNTQDILNFKAIATTTSITTIWMYCGSGTPPSVSVIESPPTSSSLPLCNALTRSAGNCRN